MRFTPTHSGPESAGIVRFGRWEFEGRSYLLIVAGAVAGVFVFILAGGFGWPARLAASALPPLAAAGLVHFFIANRPPHFAGDWLEGLATGPHFLQAPGPGGADGRRRAREVPGGEPRRRTRSATP